MDSFYSLNKLLSKLPFSILGYHENEKEIDNFFVELCDSDFISQRSHIELISYSYAKLTDLRTWGTNKYSDQFFFHSLNEKYSLLALNVYYSFRKNLFEEDLSQIKLETSNENDDTISNPDDIHTNNVAIALSRLFLKDIGFRLCYTGDDQWHFSYLEQSNLFSIKIPIRRIIQNDGDAKECFNHFKIALGTFLSESIKAIDSPEKINQLLIQKKRDSRSSYVKGPEKGSPIEIVLNKFRKTVYKPKEDLETLRNEIIDSVMFWHKSNPGYLTDVNTKEHIKNWVELFFQISFISMVYESWVEYFPSVCGVQKEGEIKQYRNLGGLILGYKKNNPITLDERSIFRIISARISAVVAGQWMFNSLDDKLLRNEGAKRLNKFWEKHLNNLTHTNGSKIEDSYLNVALIELQQLELNRILSKNIFNIIENYLKNLLIASDKDEFINKNASNLKNAIRKNIQSYRSSTIVDVKIGANLKNFHDEIFCDTEFLDFIVSRTIDNSKTHGKACSIEIEVKFYNEQASESSFKEASRMEIILTDTGNGCDLNTFPKKSSMVKAISEKYFSVLNAFGDIEFHSKEKKLVFDPLIQNKIENSSICKGFTTIIKIRIK